MFDLKKGRVLIAVWLALALLVTGICDTGTSAAVAGKKKDREVKLYLETPVKRLQKMRKATSEEWNWFQNDIGAYEVAQKIRKKGREPGEGIVVAILDTGVDTTHPALEGSLWTNKAEENGIVGVDDDGNGYVDDIYGANVCNPAQPMCDVGGHGTQLAGVMVMHSPMSTGVAPGVKVMSVRIGSEREFTLTDAIAGVRYAVENGADIINMSFAAQVDAERLREALLEASKTCVLVAAAGNEVSAAVTPAYPAGYDFVTGVMSYGNTGMLSSFTNWDVEPGKGVDYDVAAPGEKIITSSRNGKYVASDGTSHATAIVSGTMAVALSELRYRGVYMEPLQFRSWFLSSLKKKTESDPFHSFRTYPKLSMTDVYNQAKKEKPAPTPKPTPTPPVQTPEPVMTPAPTVNPKDLLDSDSPFDEEFYERKDGPAPTPTSGFLEE
ncbi:MAG: S8 family serine peptidase [Eubacterium sp.]|nr:S8 family serine peptidase [Eubacterium sp.]